MVAWVDAGTDGMAVILAVVPIAQPPLAVHAPGAHGMPHERPLSQAPWDAPVGLAGATLATVAIARVECGAPGAA